MTNWRLRPISRFISRTVQGSAIVIMEDESELVHHLANGA